ncbi:MAG: hypothetical protein OXN90_03835 [Gemmatimonadota bacterium]|nr:hypothetical protein [Gemmatimonadota bacterium]
MLRVLLLFLLLTLIAACSPDRPATTAFLKVDPAADPQQTQDRPGTPWNPLKAAAPKAGTSSSAWIEPSPASFSFAADDPAWKTFTVRTSSDVDSVLVVVNPTGKDKALEVAGGSRPPSRNYCPAEGNDSPARARRNGWPLYLSVCEAGDTEIILFDHEQTELARYDIRVQEPARESSRFNIELVFGDNISSEDRDIFRRAAQEWERVILDDLPDVVLERTFHETSPTIEKGRKVDDLLVVVHQKKPSSSHAPVFGIGAFAQLFSARPGGLPVLGQVTYEEDSRRYLTEIHEERSEFYAVGNRINGYPPYAPVDELVEQDMHTLALHEIGHVLGVGTLDQWFDYIKPAEYWDNPLPYNIIGNPFPIHSFYLSGTYAWEGFLRLRRVFEADLGSDSGAFLYYGEAIPIHDDRHHWGRIYEANLDVMSPAAGALAPNGTVLPPYISPLTRGALADLGYEVEMSTPIYDVGLDRLRYLPEPAAGKPTLSRPTFICKVVH